jgi:hypothetical protein
VVTVAADINFFAENKTAPTVTVGAVLFSYKNKKWKSPTPWGLSCPFIL